MWTDLCLLLKGHCMAYEHFYENHQNRKGILDIYDIF